MTIYENINRLIAYALNNCLIEKEDVIYTRNRLMELLCLDGETKGTGINDSTVKTSDLEDILKEITDYASENKIFEDSGIVSRDLFDTKIMGILTPPPSVVIKHFNSLISEKSEKAATDWYYKFSCDTDYIRRYRVSKDLKWKTSTKYGDLDITINLSKPEKDPKAIAAARNLPQSGYPCCLLCKENEGYTGRMNHPARQNHRIIPLKLAGEDWFLQYSPYVYYNEHCIVFDSEHRPMKIERKTFERLLDFVTQFPHYTLGSNADLPIVGGSILTHNHYQGGFYDFPMAKAPLYTQFKLKKFPAVNAGIVNWPMSVIRLTCNNKNELVNAADLVLQCWRQYTDTDSFIFSETNGEMHNTITPIARRRGQGYELDLVLRNNITTTEHPLGVYHPHEDLHHIKKENIGLIEVMGLAVLPSRLKQELVDLQAAIQENLDIHTDYKLSKHAAWIDSLNKNHIDLKEEIGKVFCKVLEDAGVFKMTSEGQFSFMKFITYCNSYI